MKADADASAKKPSNIEALESQIERLERENSEMKTVIGDAREKVEYLDNMPTLMAVSEADGTLKFANRAPLENLGLKVEDIIGNSYFDMEWWS